MPDLPDILPSGDTLSVAERCREIAAMHDAGKIQAFACVFADETGNLFLVMSNPKPLDRGLVILGRASESYQKKVLTENQIVTVGPGAIDFGWLEKVTEEKLKDAIGA